MLASQVPSQQIAAKSSNPHIAGSLTLALGVSNHGNFSQRFLPLASNTFLSLPDLRSTSLTANCNSRSVASTSRNNVNVVLTQSSKKSGHSVCPAGQKTLVRAASAYTVYNSSLDAPSLTWLQSVLPESDLNSSKFSRDGELLIATSATEPSIALSSSKTARGKL